LGPEGRRFESFRPDHFIHRPIAPPQLEAARGPADSPWRDLRPTLPLRSVVMATPTESRIGARLPHCRPERTCGRFHSKSQFSPFNQSKLMLMQIRYSLLIDRAALIT
jgi:hypothetical protein